MCLSDRAKKKKRLVALYSILTLLAFAYPISVKAQNTVNQDNSDQPMAAVLSSLETKFGLKTDKTASASVLDRLAALEMQAFGEVKPGALIDRLEELKQAPDPTQTKSSPTPEPDSNLKRKGSEPIEKYIERLNREVPYINTQPIRLYRITPVNMTVNGPTDYLDIILKATKSKVLRFNKMPIPVYITPLRNDQYVRSCISGFEAWESRTAGNIRFVQVPDQNKARIIVVWKQLGMGKDKNDCALGAHTVTKWKKRGNGKVAMMSVGAIPVPIYIPRFGPKYQVPPQVIEVNLDLIDSKRQDIKFLVLQNIVTHELGHALGILGHSDSKTDMMYPVTDEHSRISDRDLSTLSKLYGLKVDIPL